MVKTIPDLQLYVLTTLFGLIAAAGIAIFSLMVF
jgi:hypothetical protein